MQLAIASILLFVPSERHEKLTDHTLKLPTGSAAAKADLSDFSFLQGEWHGEGLGATCDEMWSQPAGNCMLGTFRMVKNGKLIFSEFCLLQRAYDGQVVLKLKHFSDKFEGWEKKDEYITFPLIKTEKDKAFFGGLTYELQADGSLMIWVAMKKKDGTFSEEAFHFQPKR